MDSVKLVRSLLEEVLIDKRYQSYASFINSVEDRWEKCLNKTGSRGTTKRVSCLRDEKNLVKQWVKDMVDKKSGDKILGVVEL